MKIFGGRRTFLAALLVACFAALGLSARDTLALVTVPPNDDYPGTTINSVPYSHSLNTISATSQADEPAPQTCAFFVTGNGSTLQNSVWWSLTPAEAATYEVEAVSDGTWAPEIIVWRASDFPGGGLTDILCQGGISFGGISDTAAHGNFRAEAAGRTTSKWPAIPSSATASPAGRSHSPPARRFRRQTTTSQTPR
jgi:hypothetical protein